MTQPPNLLKLLDAGREDQAVDLLRDGVRLVGAVGPRSAKVALEATKRLFDGDLMATIHFMNDQHIWLAGQTAIERAEQSDEGVDFLIDMIGAIEWGVYI